MWALTAGCSCLFLCHRYVQFPHGAIVRSAQAENLIELKFQDCTYVFLFIILDRIIEAPAPFLARELLMWLAAMGRI